MRFAVSGTHGLQPHRCRQFKLSTDPDFVAKLRDVVGLYVDRRPTLSCYRSTRRARFRPSIAPSRLPLKKGRLGTMTHDYKWHGTTTLFAALNVLDGMVIGRNIQRHRHQELIRFLNTIEAEVPVGKIIHVILDNYAAHKHPNVRAWLDRHPRFVFHFTPTSCSWLNAVDGFFAKLSRRRLKRGAFLPCRSTGRINRFVPETMPTRSPSHGRPTATKSSPPSKEGTKCCILSTRSFPVAVLHSRATDVLFQISAVSLSMQQLRQVKYGTANLTRCSMVVCCGSGRATVREPTSEWV